MLPGGLHVLGLLLVDATAISNASSQSAFRNKIEKLLQTIETVNNKTSFSSPEESNCEANLYVLNIDRKSGTSRVQSVQLQVDQNGNICKDAPLKWKQSDIKSAASEDKITCGPWQVVKANFILDYPVVFSPDQTEGLTLSAKVDIALEEVKGSISTATVLFDGMKRVHNSSGNYLDPSLKISTANKKDGGKKSKGKSSKKQNYEQTDDELQLETDPHVKEYTADILLGANRPIEDNCHSPNEVTIDSGSRLRFGGKMCVRVYMRPRSTIKETSNAVKEDILRSLRARLEMHCDSLVGEETKGTEKEDTPIVHEPPRRCLIGLPQREYDENFEVTQEADSVMISDFLYPGETSYDSMESVQEVFGFEPSISRMDDDQELVAGIQHLTVNSTGELTVGNVTHTSKDRTEEGNTAKFGSTESTRHSNYNLIAILLSVAIAIAGICVSYLAMSTGTNLSSEDDEFVVPSRTKDHHPNMDMD